MLESIIVCEVPKNYRKVWKFLMSKLQSQPIIPFYTVLVLLGKGVYQFRRETCALEYALKQNCHQNLDSHSREIFLFSFFVTNKNIWLKNYTNCENNEYVMNNKSILVTFISCLHPYNKLYSHLDTQKFWICIFFHSLYYWQKRRQNYFS